MQTMAGKRKQGKKTRKEQKTKKTESLNSTMLVELH